MAQQKIIRYVATNDRGIRVGEFHQHAKLTDKEVQQILDLHELACWSYRQIANTYGATKSAIACICRYERRNQTYEHWKRIEVLVEVDA